MYSVAERCPTFNRHRANVSHLFGVNGGGGEYTRSFVANLVVFKTCDENKKVLKTNAKK